MSGRQHERCAATPATHELRRHELLLLGRLAVLAQEVAKPSDVFLQAAIGHVAAVAGKDFRLRQIGARSVLVRVAEDEFARLERRAGARRRRLAGAFDDRLRKPVAVAEVIVRIVERRRRLQVQRRKHLHALALRDEFFVLDLATAALGGIAGEQDDDGVEVRAGETAHPVIRMIFSGIAEHLRAGDHALLELLGERGQRSLIHAERAQAVPGEGNRHPALVLVDRSSDRPRPTAPFRRIADSQARPPVALRNDRNS